MMRHRFVALLMVATIPAGTITAAGAVEAQETAQVRVAHMAPGAPAVDVLVDGQRAFSGLAFGQATGYAPVPAGSRAVQVTPAGQSQSPVISADLPVEAGRAYTVVAVGQLPNLAAVPLPDDNSAPPSGQAKVRVVHAAPDAPAVDIAVAGGPVLFSNLAFRNATEYAPVNVGTYTIEVRPAGSEDVALRVPDVALQPGNIVTIFATGLAGDGSLRAVPVTYPAAGGTGGPGPAALPHSGTGGVLGADHAVSTATLLIALAAVALVGSAMLVVRRSAR